MPAYLKVLQQIETEIRDNIQRLEDEKLRLQAEVEDPEQHKLYLCIWEDKFSLISEDELPEGLSWQDYQRIVLERQQTEIHSPDSGNTADTQEQLAEVEAQLKAWRFAHSMVVSYQEDT